MTETHSPCLRMIGVARWNSTCPSFSMPLRGWWVDIVERRRLMMLTRPDFLHGYPSVMDQNPIPAIPLATSPLRRAC